MKTGTINTSISKYVFGQSEVAKLAFESNGSSICDSTLLFARLRQPSVQFVHHSVSFFYFALNFCCWYPLRLLVFAVSTFPLIC